MAYGMGPGAGMGRGPGMRGFMSDEEKRNAPKVTWPLIRRVLSWLMPYRLQMGIVLAAILASSVMGVLPSVLTGRIIDEGLIAQNLPVLVRLIILSLLVTLAGNLIGVLESWLNTWIAQHIVFDMRNQMYRKLQKMSHRFFTENNQGDIITRMTSDIDGVQQVITGTFTSILSNAVTLAVAVTAMVQRNWILALLGMVIVPLFTIPTRKAGKTRWELTRQSQQCRDEVNGILNETMSVSGQLLVKLFCREGAEYARYRDVNEQMIRLNIKESMAGRWFRVVISTISSVGPMLLYLVGGVLMMRYDSSLTVGDITVLVALLGRMYGPVNSLLNIQVDWLRAMALFTRIFEYFDMEEEIRQPEEPVWIPESRAEGKICFDHVSFRYNSDREILKDVSFTLEPGRCIAIVGPSGSGKSTTVNLIPRLYDVTGGAVYFDGIDVRQMDLAQLRSNIGIVTQETYLFNGTIRDNLLYVKPEASEEELMEACKKANIHDFIMSQKDGYDTVVGNRGLKLSGGEKQRLSIARVLLKDPALMIFDEATSSLDSISEQMIQEAIEPLIASRTSILIAHRLSTVQQADEILVMKDGKIAERGCHESLLARGGVYARLYHTQMCDGKAA